MSVPQPNPKPAKRSAEDRRRERAEREPNPYKETVLRKSDRSGNRRGDRYLRPGSTLRSVSLKRQKDGVRSWGMQRKRVAGVKVKGIRSRGFTVRQAPVKIDRKALAKVGRRGKRYRKQDASLKAAMLAIWGERCLGSFLGQCRGPIEMMHIQGKGAHPDQRGDIANVLPGCVFHHREAPQSFQFTPELTKALWGAGDLLRAAADNKRPQPSWEELEAEVYRVYQNEMRRRKK